MFLYISRISCFKEIKVAHHKFLRISPFEKWRQCSAASATFKGRAGYSTIGALWPTLKCSCSVVSMQLANYVENGRRQHMASGALDESQLMLDDPCRLPRGRTSKPSLQILALYESQILYAEHRSFILADMNKWCFVSTIRTENI